jgi:hypothetical protein
MKTRNQTLYIAMFSKLKLDAFGIRNVLDYTTEVEIYQARVSPELWRGRPMFKRLAHKWEAASAEALMELISADFEVTLRPWKEYPAPIGKPARPSLRKAPEDAAKTA